MSVGDWLRTVGLQQYESIFTEHAIDTDVLLELTESDLEKLGVLLGDRKRFLKAVKTLRDSSPSIVDTGQTHSPNPPTFSNQAEERRHLTIMICDLVDSTALTARLDPEDMRAVMDAYHAACARITRFYDGFLADFRGDGILAIFGYPQAHEDDAERTVRAGLDIAAAVARLETPAATPLAVRIGIATGLVHVRSVGGEGELRDHFVVGDAPNIAARLQSLILPGTVVVADSTRRLLGDRFRLRDLGRHEFKGVTEPVAAFAVEAIAAAESRFEASHLARLTNLIDREKEMEFLLERKDQAWKGEGQIVLISGEAGIGKSRLVAAFEGHTKNQPHTVLRCQCSPYYSNSALYPIIEQLERTAGFKPDDTPEQRLDKLEAILARNAAPSEDTAPLLAALLSIPFGDRWPPLVLNPAQQRRRTLSMLLDQFENLARQKPLLLIFEDTHWADATSLELLDLAIERIRHLPFLALFTLRPDFEAPWAGLPNVSTLTLGRLDPDQVGNIIMQMTQGGSLPTEVMKEIVSKTDGNPLFVEELTKAVLESDILVRDANSYRLSGPLPPLAIPATLQDSLMARLDRLQPVKDTAQLAATIGREFSYALIREVATRDETALRYALAKLEQAELLFRRGDPPYAVYSFKHALVRDSAYESLLKSRRQLLHGQIAQTIETKFPEIAASQPEIVARHFTEAGLAEHSVGYWIKAGHLALSRSANTAVSHLNEGLKQIPLISDAAQRNKLELLLQTALGNSLQAAQGWSSVNVKHAYTRALELCKETGLDEHTLPVVFGLWTWNFVHPSLGEAQVLARYLLRTAEKIHAPAYQVLAHEALGFTLFAQGQFTASHTELRQSLSMCVDSAAGEYFELSAQDPRVHVRLYEGLVLWFLGYPDQALRSCAEARRYADQSQHPYSEAMARTISLRVCQLRGEVADVAARVDAAIALCEEHEFIHYLAVALILRGWARAQQNDFEKGVADIQRGREMQRANGALLYESYTLALLAEACTKNERYSEALDFLGEAEARLNDQNCERFYEVEIYRLLGEAHSRLGNGWDQAEQWFQKGLQLAREQKSRSLELKLRLSMYDLRETSPDADEYRSHLKEAYSGFSEGFETADLMNAKAKLGI